MAKQIIKILVVDDDAAIRDSIRLALEEQDVVGVKITECADVDTGIQKMAYTIPDVVILDLHLPDKSGWEFVKIMRGDTRLAKTKLIMLTADDSLDNIFKGEDMGIEVYEFLGKPFNIAELQSLVIGQTLPPKK